MLVYTSSRFNSSYIRQRPILYRKRWSNLVNVYVQFPLKSTSAYSKEELGNTDLLESSLCFPIQDQNTSIMLRLKKKKSEGLKYDILKKVEYML